METTTQWNELHLTSNNIIISNIEGCLNGNQKIETLEWNLIMLINWRFNDEFSKVNDIIEMYLKNHKVALCIMESMLYPTNKANFC